MPEKDFRIRRAAGLNDYFTCVDLQKKVWGYTQFEDIAAQPMLMISDRFGGNVLIAEDSAGVPIGFAFAMPGWKAGKRLFWWSHMTGVLLEHRGKDIGLALKLRQRDEAIAAGIDLIEWTFDPLQSLNAHFNLNKLGVVVREYEDNVYGNSSSALHRGLPTDRFVAEWHLKESRPEVVDAKGASRILEGGNPPNLALEDDALLMEIPVDLEALKKTDPEATLRWQTHLRAASHHYFERGYAVTGFSRPFYVLRVLGTGH